MCLSSLGAYAGLNLGMEAEMTCFHYLVVVLYLGGFLYGAASIGGLI